MSGVLLNTSGVTAVSQPVEPGPQDRGAAANQAPDQGANKRISNALIARVFNVSKSELESYEAIVKQQQASQLRSTQSLQAASEDKQANAEPGADDAALEGNSEGLLGTVFKPWSGGKPQSVQALIDFMASRGFEVDVNDAANFLYGTVGVNADTRNFDAILNAPDPFDANNQALGRMFNDKNFAYHAAHEVRLPAEEALRVGTLMFSQGRLYAQPENGSQWVPVKLARPGQLKSAGLARFGIRNEDAQAVADNPGVSEKVKELLRAYLGTGYDAQAAQRYSTVADSGFDLASFLKEDMLASR